MKNLANLIIVPALALFSSLASAAVYTGDWFNRTAVTDGPLTIDFTVGKKAVTGFIDFDGPVFGGGDPPAVPLNAKLKKDGSGSFLIKGTAMGDIDGNFTKNGALTVVITNIPAGFSQVRIDGKFDLKIESFTATYEIYSGDSVIYEGDAKAHVPQKATVKAPKKVNFSGKRGRATVKVLTNTDIKKVKATAKKAKVKVTGENPYKVTVSKAKKKKTSVKLTVVNDDGFKTKKTIKFVDKGK